MPHQLGSSKKIAGLSKSAIRHSERSSGSGHRSHVLHSGKQRERMAAVIAKRRAVIEGLSQEDRDVVHAMDIDHGPIDAETSAAFDTIPPGDEGVDISHEGGEYELAAGYTHLMGIHRVDARDRRDRIEIENANWKLQIDYLVTSYLSFHMQAEAQQPDFTVDPPDQLGQPLPTVDLIDAYVRKQASLTTRTSEIYPNQSLIRRGFLGSSPLHPTVAFSLRVLTSFRQTHRTCPRLSIEAYCKTLCHLHTVPYHPLLAEQFSSAYDIYLEIQRRVGLNVRAALRHDSANYRLLNICPACFYQLEDEPQMEYSFFCTFDGNNSMKRMGAWMHNATARQDSRTLDSDRWLSPQQVDRFKDEVIPKATGDPDVDDWEDLDNDDPTLTECIKRWRNAGPEQRKKTVKSFDESGIFIMACRHRFVLFGCDMIRSGELMKYPLAMVDRLFEVYGDKYPKIGSLGQRAQELQFRLMVGAFHGHAHNRGCQLRWHPLYISGTGHFEGEGCEHIFSSSNDQARTTRHATWFHRRQAIFDHFDHWDEDKYAALGTFLGNHYEEAHKAVSSLETELSTIKRELDLSDQDLANFLQQERAYLDSLEKTPIAETLKIKYVRTLRELTQFQSEWNLARAAANEALTNIAPNNIYAVVTQARRRVDATYAKLQNCEAYVFNLENQLGISDRWTEDSSEYVRYKQEAVLQEYRTALDELERLVVMRLFELSKLGISGTGYKLRRHIAKALQRRSEAIRKALSRYNTQAAKLTPPRPSLAWKDIAEYSFLAEFDLLRNSRNDVRQERWAQPAYREAVGKFFKLCRAREEILRLNTEIPCIRTKIHYESLHVQQTIQDLTLSNPPLCAALRRWWIARSAVNNLLIRQLNTIEQKTYFTGRKGFIGVRSGVGGTQSPQGGDGIEEPPQGGDGIEELPRGADEAEGSNPTDQAELEKLAYFMERITDLG